MNDPEVFAEPCAVCRRNKATKLCDYVVDYLPIIFMRDYFSFLEENQHRYLTCDLPMCDNCAITYNGFDFCPHHDELRKKAKLPDQLERARWKMKAKLYLERGGDK